MKNMATTGERSAARRFFEDILSTGDWSRADDIASPDLVMHHPSSPQPIAGRDRVKEALLAYRAAFPDMRFDVEDEICCGDKVVIRWRASGRNTGSLWGIPPTGRPVTVSGLSVMRVQSGLVVEDWVEEDQLGMMQQLGLVPLAS
jgi:predicted ester cyclase